ncbi:intercompartmental signaling factor BofC [Mesobacillus maritimus]|uniref:intercompartmental signaling factor BofC n=1 Tax=Mesobacillus maritimus TaxID=1643336 RepID=UPI00203D6305|nr:intercompartmental signaling factor BofC [Mesobacillus maritimus]MCM3587690.1 intercompartmental signaling factor BofC [Mesobacillus maritimus]MCM3669935.1 intercompartmental signaling factor BofC [Mesobacillus maritimus]
MGVKSVVKTLSVLVACSAFMCSLNSGMVVAAQPNNQTKDEAVPLNVTVILERAYLDGEISEEQISETVSSMEDLWQRYDGWQLVRIDEDIVVFKQDVDDISPLLKANGYFGLTENGVLTIFNGRPDQSNIIQSFFQIDVGKLESRKRQQLQKGIPIKTKDQYEKVIEAFRPYTRDNKQ